MHLILIGLALVAFSAWCKRRPNPRLRREVLYVVHEVK